MSEPLPPGPDAGPTSPAYVGLRTPHPQCLKFGHVSGSIPLNELAGHIVRAGERLRYFIRPEQDSNDSYAATFIAIDLVFRDGSRMSETAPLDQYGTLLTPLAQGASKMGMMAQWNHVESDLTAFAGSVIDHAEAVYESPWSSDALASAARFSLPLDTLRAEPPGTVMAWLDDVTIEIPESCPGENELPLWVDTRRGSNSSGDFSRGNNLPITAWPNGFCFWAPATDARTNRWPYEYHRGNGPDNRPRLQCIGISHQPSPWMGDRNQLFFMPGIGASPQVDPVQRALPFSHDNETAQPHLYSVAFDNGLRFSTIPTDHGGMLRIELADAARTLDARDGLHLVIDSIDDSCGFEWADGAISGWVDNGENHGRVRMFIAAVPDVEPTRWGPAPGGNHTARVLSFDPAALHDDTVHLRVATSFISVEQAQRNLELELGENPDSSAEWDRLSQRAYAAWNERLGVITVEDATPHQLRTLYGCLYRMNLYPNSSHENVGTAEEPRWAHASSVLEHGESTPTYTGAQVREGTTYVNNGFWDTYRTMWPALSLLYPELTARMIEGFIQQYREGGWVARWSSPGYADLMTGTSSDVAFADAFLRSIEFPDPMGTYEAGLKNATVAPPVPEIGRKGIATSIFTGYTDASEHESVSWALEGYINDYGLSLQASALADRIESGSIPCTDPAARAARLREESAYLRARAAHYCLLFDSRIGFFQGRNIDGAFAQSPDEFDPEVWGGDFTETNGWNFAFHAAHDPAGLAHLYGGPDGLKAKLDAFFSTPETAEKYGTYGFTIHEMHEAKAVRMGQYGFSNQPAHHIAHMYNYAGDIHSTQEIVHEVLRRLFTGEQIGQGYPGDEDNGEMSAWYVLNALGIYPLRVGSPEWALGSPLYAKAHVKPLGGQGFTMVARGWTPESVYVTDAVLMNDTGRTPLAAPSVTHQELLGSTLEFSMCDERPEHTGYYGSQTAPSLTEHGCAPQPLIDHATTALLNGDEARTLPELVDNTSETTAQLGNDAVITIQLDAATMPRFITLTSGARDNADPADITIEGRTADGSWISLRPRTVLRFPWRRQTVPLEVTAHTNVDTVRISLDGAGDRIELAQVEVLS